MKTVRDMILESITEKTNLEEASKDQISNAINLNQNRVGKALLDINGKEVLNTVVLFTKGDRTIVWAEKEGNEIEICKQAPISGLTRLTIPKEAIKALSKV